MPTPQSLPPRMLLEHASSLRRLALALVRDSDTADDVVQDTWVRALEAPPSRLEALGAWLRTVLLHIVANRHRAEARRSSRENDVARSVFAPQSGERERTLRGVVEAVLALDEPLRTVVMLRHFEGLAPRDIAERLRVPTTVVYNRLHRAHAQLRTRLEREDRSWASALAVLAGVNQRQWLLKTACLGGGALIMSLKTQVALLSAAGLLITGLCVWRSASNASSAVAPSAAAEQPTLEVPREDGVTQLDAAAGIDERSAVADQASEPVATRPLPPYEFALEFTVTDADDAPLAGATVFLAPQSHPLDRAGQTDGEGGLVVRWRGFVESMDVVVAVSTNDQAPAEMRIVHVRAASQQRVALRAASGGGWFLRQGARQVLELRLTQSAHALSDVSFVTHFTGESADTQQMRACDDGFAYFVDPWMARCAATEQAPSVQAHAEFREFRLALEGLAVSFGGDLQLDFSGLGELAPVPRFELKGQVLGLEDKPLAQVLVRVRREGAHQWIAVRTDEEGNYQFEPLDVANYEIVAGDGDNGLARSTISGSDGATLRYDARLDRGRELRGRLLGLDGQPLANWTVELMRVDALAPWIDLATTDDAGLFHIPSLPGGGFTLLARPADAQGATPLVGARNAWPTAEQQDFTVAVEAFGGVRVEIVDESDKPFIGAQVRVWRDDVERGQRLENHSAANVFASDTLFPGLYRVEIGAPARGWMSIEQIFVKAGDTLDIGRIRLAAPARLEVAANAVASDEPFRAVFVRRGAEVESLSAALECKAPLAIEIQAGEYERAARFEELTHTSKVVVRAGETRALEAPAAKPSSELPEDH